MILISNNIQKYMDLPKDSVIRINMAWIKTIEELNELLYFNFDKKIFLDYPQGRTKPPVPLLLLQDAYNTIYRFGNIKYFAVSNIEDVENVLNIKNKLPKTVEFVPKIETLNGINNLKNLINKCEIKYIMLDKEDLYIDIKKDNDKFFNCIESIRNICKELNVKLLELEGVIFTQNIEEKIMDLNPNIDIYSDDLPIWERGQAGGRIRPIDRETLFKNLVEVSEVLKKYNIKHWISHGTMLGAYRDQNFIEWDDDADIGLDFSQREDPNFYKAVDELRGLGYFIPLGLSNIPITKDNAPYYDVNFIRDGEKIEGWFFEKKGDFYLYDEPRCKNDLKHPAKYYDELQDFNFRGHIFKIPNHVENWLVMMYNDGWKIPDKNKKYNNQK